MVAAPEIKAEVEPIKEVEKIEEPVSRRGVRQNTEVKSKDNEEHQRPIKESPRRIRREYKEIPLTENGHNKGGADVIYGENINLKEDGVEVVDEFYLRKHEDEEGVIDVNAEEVASLQEEIAGEFDRVNTSKRNRNIFFGALCAVGAALLGIGAVNLMKGSD